MFTQLRKLKYNFEPQHEANHRKFSQTALFRTYEMS
jgi:hypothetical protein